MGTWFTRWRRTCLALVFAFGLPASTHAPAATAQTELLVYAAADLTFAFRALEPVFERATGTTVTFVFGSTGLLGRQIEHGAPADVFFAADEATIDDLIAKRVLVADSRARYAQGSLAIVSRSERQLALASLPDLTSTAVARLALANPAYAPYGRAAEDALRRAGLLEALRPKIVYADNIRQALQFVESGAADAGIVSHALTPVEGITAVGVDPALHAPINQAAAVVARSGQRALAERFLAFVLGDDGRAILSTYGFRSPATP